MKANFFKLDVVKKDTETLVRTYRIPLVLVSLLMGFLLFIMNIFLGISFQGQNFNDQMKSKLGVYIYLKDGKSQQQQAVQLKTELESKGLKVNYTSKEDALKFVERRVEDLTKTLKKYNLENPMPSTLYINYAGADQFAEMKQILEKNKDAIINMNDLSDNVVKTQEKRVFNIINLSNVLQSFGYLIVGLMGISVLVFAVFFLQAMFEHFKKDVQAKKLLGASTKQIAQPFLRVIFLSLGMAFVLAVLLLIGASLGIETYLASVFNFSLVNAIADVVFEILAVGVVEIIVMMFILMGVSYWQVMRWNKKLK